MPMELLQRLHHDQDGASAVIVGLSLFVLLGASMIAIDVGNLWQTRRNVISGTDATALAVAAEAASQPDPTTACSSSWTGLVEENAGAEAELTDCEVVLNPLNPDTGYVVVDAQRPAAALLSRVFGFGDQDIVATSVASFAYADGVRGLRPIGLCLHDPHVNAYLNGAPDTGYDPQPDVHRVFYGKDDQQLGDCDIDQSAGNWGFLDFDGTGNTGPGGGEAALQDWLLHGYNDAPVHLSDPIQGDTGSGAGQLADELEELKQSGDVFHIVVYSQGTGTGKTRDYAPYRFLGVRLVDYCVTNNHCDDPTGERSGQDARYFDLEFVESVTEGAQDTVTETGAMRVRICSVDHDELDRSTRCFAGS